MVLLKILMSIKDIMRRLDKYFGVVGVMYYRNENE